MRYEIIDNDSGEVIRRCHTKPAVPAGCRLRVLPRGQAAYEKARAIGAQFADSFPF
jgi:hypothetical protein